jgi:anti-sigma factor RsiW
MRCSKVQRLLTPYVDDRLTEGQRAQVDAHVAACPGCAKELRILLGSQTAMRALDPAVPPSDLAGRVADGALARPQGVGTVKRPGLLEQISAWRWPALVTAGAAAAAAVVLLLNVKLPSTAASALANAREPVAALASDREAGLDLSDMAEAVLAQPDEEEE